MDRNSKRSIGFNSVDEKDSNGTNNKVSTNELLPINKKILIRSEIDNQNLEWGEIYTKEEKKIQSDKFWLRVRDLSHRYNKTELMNKILY